MRPIPPAFAAHLAEGVTTLARCWRLVRRDGVALGFTDHDRDLSFDGLAFAAETGWEAAEAVAALGLAADGGEVAGALRSDAIAAADVEAGLYDDALVETWLVNWADPAERLLLSVGSIGEVRRRDGAFAAELRGPAHRYDAERGPLYTGTCDAALGDARCKVDLASPAYGADAAVSTTDGALRVATADLTAFPPGFFAGGALRFLTGQEAGRSVPVAAHRVAGGVATLDLWRRAARPIAPGDAFRATAGCDGRLATCAARFANVLNFRGFPHMPGNDFVLRSAATGEAGLDGGSLFR